MLLYGQRNHEEKHYRLFIFLDTAQLIVAGEVTPADVLDRDMELESIPCSRRQVSWALDLRYLTGYLDASSLRRRVHRGWVRRSGCIRLLREDQNG